MSGFSRDSTGSALVVFSGGQDSTTCLYWAKERFSSVAAITFSYGQRHRVELESAARIARLAGVDHEIVDIGPALSGCSTLTNNDEAVPSVEQEPGGECLLPSTFVPGRNIIFLAMAGSRAYTLNCASIICGVSQEDFSGYPDCRSQFIKSMESALCAGLDRQVEIICPLMNLSKKETVELALTLPGCMEALSYSTTCYNGSIPPCRTCSSCALRQKGFAQASVDDPLLVRLEEQR